MVCFKPYFALFAILHFECGSLAAVVDEWKLIFKAATGGVGNVYHLYIGNETVNINNLAAQSLTNPIQEHFKSDIINHWSESGIVQVRVAVYKRGVDVAFFLFDGRDSNYTNWFIYDNIINSSYTDLSPEYTVPINYCSIAGCCTKSCYGYSNSTIRKTGGSTSSNALHVKMTGSTYDVARRFYINSEWGGCPADSGWLMIVDQDANGGCPGWEEPYLAVKPAILYSPLSTKTVYSKVQKNLLADSLTISVKYDSRNLTCFSVCSKLIQMNAFTYCHKPCTYPADLEQKIEQLKKELTVDKKTTSLYRRSLMSVYEDRTSAKSMGLTGVAVIVSVLGFVASMDCLRFQQNKVTPKKRKKTKQGTINEIK